MDWADLSSNNGAIDVRAYARSGRTFLMLKATEGTGYRWYGGDGLHTEAHAAGLNVGRYGWLRPDADPVAQADYFVDAIKDLVRPGDVAMTDFEATYGAADPGDAARARQLRAFNTRIGNRLPHIDLWVYTGNWYLAGKPACQSEVRRWPVVMSDYSSYGDGQVPNPYRLNYVARQYTDRASFPGLAGTGDGNRFYSSAATASAGHQLLTTGGPHMFSLYRDSTSGHWYIGAVGYFAACRSRRDVLVAAHNPLCVNGADARAVLEKGNRQALARLTFATRTLADIKTQLLTIGGTK